MSLMETSSTSCPKMDTTLSAWTPLNHSLSNGKVFAERRILLAKWFDMWSDSQRKAILQDFMLGCSVDQLRWLSISVGKLLPLQAADFTCLLPRAVCLYLFSYLDPRSLCRCAQVSWQWKSIVELDQLWMPKSVKFGWVLSFMPTPFEQGIWKRHYIQMVEEMRLGRSQILAISSQQKVVIPDITVTTTNGLMDPAEETFLNLEPSAFITQGMRSSSVKSLVAKTGPPPWRYSDKYPKDIMRFNYLDNVEPGEQTLQARNKSRPPSYTNGKAAVDGIKKTLSETDYKLRKAKSLMHLGSATMPLHPPLPPPNNHQNLSRPNWALNKTAKCPVTKDTTKSLLQMQQWNAGVRPQPVKMPVPVLSEDALKVLRRSQRSLPSKTKLSDVKSEEKEEMS